MGFFSDLGKLSLGGSLVSGATGKKNMGSAGGTLLFGKKEKKKGVEPFDPGTRVGSTIGGQSGVDQPAMRLGWTNGGYTYNNSPFNPAPKTPPMGMGAPMSMGGGAAPGAAPSPSPMGVAPPTRIPMPMPADPRQSSPKMDPRMMQQMMMAGALRNKQFPVM